MEPDAVYFALVQVPMRSRGLSVAVEDTVFPPHRQQLVGSNVISLWRSVDVNGAELIPLQYFLEVQTLATAAVLATSNINTLARLHHSDSRQH